MTVEQLVYSLENDIDTCYIYKEVDLLIAADIHTDSKGIKDYFYCKVKTFNLELVSENWYGEIYNLNITLEEEQLNVRFNHKK